MFVYFYYHLIEKALILINKFSKHNQKNISSCDIKYIFSVLPVLFLVIVNTKVYSLSTIDKTLCCIVYTLKYYC